MFGFLHNGPTLFDRAFLPSSRVLKNGKSLLKYVGRKVGSSSTGVHLADQTRMLAAVVEPESVVCATSLDASAWCPHVDVSSGSRKALRGLVERDQPCHLLSPSPPPPRRCIPYLCPYYLPLTHPTSR
jgi:hypothetical protein